MNKKKINDFYVFKAYTQFIKKKKNLDNNIIYDSIRREGEVCFKNPFKFN